MSTDVEIASRALLLLGAPEITALGDGSTESNVANAFFLPTLDYLLGLHPWNFAFSVAELVEDVPPTETSPGPYDEPIYEDWPYAYDRPASVIRILKVTAEGKDVRWEEKGLTHIAADEPPVLELTYIARPTIADLPAFFLQPFEDLLASRMAVPITQKGSLAEVYRKAFKDSFARSRNVDATQSTAQRLRVGQLRAVRG